MKVMVSDQEIFRRKPQLAQLKLGVNFLNRLISDTTKIELEDDFTLEATFRKPNDDQVSFNIPECFNYWNVGEVGLSETRESKYWAAGCGSVQSIGSGKNAFH